jgi:hypothetical protein
MSSHVNIMETLGYFKWKQKKEVANGILFKRSFDSFCRYHPGSDGPGGRLEGEREDKMTSIALFEQKRRAYYRGWLVGFILFTVLWVVRFVLRWAGVQSEILYPALAIGFVLVIPLMFHFIVRMDSLRRQAKNDPELNALLQDELIKHHELKAWKFGFIAMAVSLGVFVVLSVFLDLKDTNAVLFTALWAGFGGYHLSFYNMERE